MTPIEPTDPPQLMKTPEEVIAEVIRLPLGEADLPGAIIQALEEHSYRIWQPGFPGRGPNRSQEARGVTLRHARGQHAERLKLREEERNKSNPNPNKEKGNP